jgi:hypothetical protein
LSRFVDDKQQVANCEDETSFEEQLQALLERLQSVQAQHPGKFEK